MVDIRVAPGRAHCERKRVADSVRCKKIHDQEILSYPIPIFLLNLGVLLGLFDFSVAGARANKLEKQGPVEQFFSGKNPNRTSQTLVFFRGCGQSRPHEITYPEQRLEKISQERLLFLFGCQHVSRERHRIAFILLRVLFLFFYSFEFDFCPLRSFLARDPASKLPKQGPVVAIFGKISRKKIPNS